MIKIKIKRIDYRNNNTPVLYDREIDEFAHEVLADYKPNLLREPGSVRFEHFLESYLGVTVMFKDIYSDDPDRPIFGVTAFRDGTLKIFDRENKRTLNMIVRANTVVIDNYVMESERSGLAMFTGLHEAGHLLIHPAVYAPEHAGKLDLSSRKLSGMVYCRRDSVESFGGSRSLQTAMDWREHQADYFAAALAMPNATFVPFVNEFLREHDVWKRCIVIGSDDDLDILAQDLLPERISEVYGVSKRAASVKLRKSGFIADAIKNQGE